MIYRKNEADFLSQPLISHLYKLFIINSSSGVIKERGLLIMEPVNRTLGKECKFTGFFV